jgi:DNA mismatch repair protein MutS
MNQHDPTNTSSTEYIKIHETEKSGNSLQITKKRGQILKQILVNIPDIILQHNTITITIKPADIKIVSATSGNDEIHFHLLQKTQKDILRLKDELNDCISESFSVFLDKVVQEEFININRIIKYISKLDVLYNKAFISREYNLCKPVIMDSEKAFVDMVGLRHILIEQINQKELYVSNDLDLGCQDGTIGTIIYGTNAVGKTSFIRAAGIAVIMAQSGMYVPCSKFTYKPYQAIFTRILGNDNLFKGLSTFAVEMSELRLILKMADKNSLVLGDELCSGTEIESALSIFMAGLMALHKKEVSFIFATHFHEILKYDEMRELTKLSVKHLSVIYDRERDCLIYDRKLKPGSGSRMYGLEVCKSLYLPQEFLDCAYQLRAKYNSDSRGELKNPDAPKYNAAKIRGICEMCKTNIGEEIHHLQEQILADKEGYIEGSYKNHAGNLMSICKSCHDGIHHTTQHIHTVDDSINISLMTNEVVNIIGKKSGNKMLKRKTTAGYIIGKG